MVAERAAANAKLLNMPYTHVAVLTATPVFLERSCGRFVGAVGQEFLDSNSILPREEREAGPAGDWVLLAREVVKMDWPMVLLDIGGQLVVSFQGSESVKNWVDNLWHWAASGAADPIRQRGAEEVLARWHEEHGARYGGYAMFVGHSAGGYSVRSY